MKTFTLACFRLVTKGSLSAAPELQEALNVPGSAGGIARDAVPIAEAHYSFGTAACRDGTVLFTEFNRGIIKRWNPNDRTTDVWRTKRTPGMFGLSVSPNGDVFVGVDLGDNGDPGKVLRIGVDGTEVHIIEGVTRPRQLTCDVEGNLFVVLEGGKILKWNHATATSAEVMSAQSPVSGVAVGSDGSLYVSEYATFRYVAEGYSCPESAGVVKVRRPDGTIRVLASGFWRARGLALSGSRLYLCTEADREDHGNSGRLVRIDTLTGEQETLLDNLDYPQFPSVDSQGRIYFTLGRDNKLMLYDPESPFQVVSSPDSDVQKARVRGCRITWNPLDEETGFSIRSKDRMLRGSLHPDGNSGFMDVCFDMSASCFELSSDPLFTAFDGEHPSPGIFELPSVQTRSASGLITIHVLPIRCHQGKRWPMQNAGTPNESPAPGFCEKPEVFRFHVHWSPLERSQP
jgi:streptogramin lyase